MPNITQIEVFNNANELVIPLASNQPTTVSSVATPNNKSALENLIVEVEQDILINALGLTIYNELQTALNDLLNADIKWRNLVNGVEYDGKKWEGLSSDYSLLAFAIYYLFLNGNTQFYTALGVAQPNAENSTMVSPTYKLTTAWNKFISKYQGGSTEYPTISYTNGIQFTDWKGHSNKVFVSLYEYLVDKKEDFGWEFDNFTYYDTKNTFGI